MSTERNDVDGAVKHTVVIFIIIGPLREERRLRGRCEYLDGAVRSEASLWLLFGIVCGEVRLQGFHP